MYRISIIKHTIDEILALENSNKVLTQQKLHIFLIFKYQYLSNGKSDDNNPIHIWKVLTKDYQLKKTVSKHIQIEANDVIIQNGRICYIYQYNAENIKNGLFNFDNPYHFFQP